MRYVLACLLTLAFGVLTNASSASAASLEGSWRGGGKVKLADGQVEPVRCRLRYEKGDGRTFVLYANCAHANGTFQQSGRIVKLGANRYSGRMRSDQYSVSGQVSIRVNGKRQTLTAKSLRGTATVVLTKQ